MKRIFKNRKSFALGAFALTIVGLLLLAGCEDRFKWSIPLSLAQRDISLTKAAGSTHVLVYATGDWTLHFTKDITWATLDRVQGSGNGEFVFTYTYNYDYERTVGVEIVSGSLRDTVTFTQAGNVGSARYTFGANSLELTKSPQTVRVSSSVNTPYDLSFYTVNITYYDEDGNSIETVAVETKADGDEDEDEYDGEEGEEGDEDVWDDEYGEIPVNEEDAVLLNWISNVRLATTSFTFDVSLNPLSYARTALITVNSPTDASSITISQTAGGPVFVLDYTMDEYSYKSQSVTVPAMYNNIAGVANQVVFDVTYPDGSDTEGDWILNPSISTSGLTFSLSQNDGGSARSGVIGLSYTDALGSSVSASYSVTQQGFVE